MRVVIFVNKQNTSFGRKMALLEDFIENLYEYLIEIRCPSCSIIRKHSKKLNTLGDISFPLNISSWTQVTNNHKSSNLGKNDSTTIFDYLHEAASLDEHLEKLVELSQKWDLHIGTCKIIDHNVHMFIDRPAAFSSGINTVWNTKELYGFTHKIFKTQIQFELDSDVESEFTDRQSLGELRLNILRNVLSNLVSSLTEPEPTGGVTTFRLTLKSNAKDSNVIVCGTVLNEKGCKDTTTTAAQMLQKRVIDLELMSQHKYGLRAKSLPNWNEKFQKWGRGSITIEMLENKPHKNIKMTTKDSQTAQKGPAFILYNCARLAVLFREFESQVAQNIYPKLPPIYQVDFSLLTEPEEWTLFFVYVLQFPLIVKDCVKDIQQGFVRPHYLISFLSSLASDFSVYYRRVRILRNPRHHLFGVLFARIYFLRALEQVIHSALKLLDIDPIQQM